MGRELASDRVEFYEAGNDDYSDLELIYHVRDSLTSVLLGNRDNYDELVAHLHPKQRPTPDQVALLVTTLKALTGAVSYIDLVHHEALLFAVLRLSMWSYGTDVMDALVELIISLASSGGKYLDLCLDMLVRNFVPPYYFLDSLKQPYGLSRKKEVLSRVHAALKAIADLVPLAPMRLSPIVVQRMPNIFSKEPEIVIYVENMFKLENGAIKEIVGGTMLAALVDRMIELDVEIGWDNMLQDDGRGMFEIELEDFTELADKDEEDDSMGNGKDFIVCNFIVHISNCWVDRDADAIACTKQLLEKPAMDEIPGESFSRKSLQGNVVAEKLDSLMVLTFEHLESCQSSGRLAEVFDVLLASFQKTVLNAYKSKFTQFVMFYTCALDPEECGVKFATRLADMFVCDVNPPITRMSAVAYLASYMSRGRFLSAALVISILQRLLEWCFEYCKLHDDDMKPLAHQVFYSGCQAIMYVLCFHLKSLMVVPRLKLQLLNMPIELVLTHKLSPLKVCLPTVVEEFLQQAKAAQLFTTSKSFIFNDLLESDLSRAFGGMDRLDMFFPFDPCLLRKSDSYIKQHFIYWSKVRPPFDSDDEGSDSCSDVEDDHIGTSNAEDMIDDGMVESFDELRIVLDSGMNRMSITPKNSLMHVCKTQSQECRKMPSRIRPSTSPESL